MNEFIHGVAKIKGLKHDGHSSPYLPGRNGSFRCCQMKILPPMTRD